MNFNQRRFVSVITSIVCLIGMTGLSGLLTVENAPPAQADPLILPSWVVKLADPPGTASFPGLIAPNIAYDLYRDQYGHDLLVDSSGNALPIANWQTEVSTRIAEQVKGSSVMAVSSFDPINWAIDDTVPRPTVILQGDTINVFGGMGAGQRGGNAPADGSAAGVWSVKNDFTAESGDVYNLFGERLLGGLMNVTYTQGAGQCATAAPSVNANLTVADLWCLGVGTFTGTLSNIKAPTDTSGNYTGFSGRFGFSPLLGNIRDTFSFATTPESLTGPNRNDLGSYATETGTYLVLAPSISLIKEVCVTGTGCDPDLITGDNAPVPDSVDNTTGQWVDDATIPIGSTAVQWRITVKNTGNIPLVDVHMANDKVSTDPSKPQDSAMVGANSCTTHSFGTLQPGASQYFDCTTGLLGELTGELVNEANVNASLPATLPFGNSGDSAVTETPLNDPSGIPISNRIMGHNGELGKVPSNSDAAKIHVPHPGLKLTKWVCSLVTGCVDPTTNPAVLQSLSGYDPATGVVAGIPAGGWVKETVVPYNAKAQWLVVVTNTGDTYLKDVQLSEEFTTDAGINPTTLAAPLSSPLINGMLAPGESAVYRPVTAHVLNTNQFNSAVSASTDAFGEPEYEVGNDIVNYAQARGTPILLDGNQNEIPVIEIDNGTKQIKGAMASNTSNAEATTRIPEASIALTKWVCDGRDDCVAPAANNVTPATLAAAGWVKMTTVPYNTTAKWLLVITNTGEVQLDNIKLTEEFQTGVGQGVTSGCSQGDVVTTSLASGASYLLTCTTANITNTNPWGNGDVVNTAKASGEPADDDGPLPNPNGPTTWVVESAEDSAEVNTTLPLASIALTKWVCDGRDDCIAPGASDVSNATLAANGWVKMTTVPYNTSAKWLLVITNTGDVGLTNVTLSKEFLTGIGHGATTGCSPGDVVVAAPTVLAAGDSFVLTCTTVNITNTKAWGSGDDVINTAQASGEPAYSNGNRIPRPNGGTGTWTVESNEDSAEVNTLRPNASIALTKWVCNGRDDCVAPAADDVNATTLAAAGWVKATTVPYNTSAKWLLVITNTGDVKLNNIKLSEETLTGAGHGAMSAQCLQGASVVPSLAAGATYVVTCTTVNITNTQALGSGNDVVNTARASGEPVNDNDIPLPPPDDGDNPWTVESEPDDAEVNTEVPNASISLTKWVCNAKDDCVAPAVTNVTTTALAAAGWVKATTVAYSTSAQWLLVLTNTGDVKLANITLIEEYLTGTGHGATTADCAQGSVVVSSLVPGASYVLTCKTATITNTNAWGAGDVVNTAQASGEPVDDNDNPIPPPNGGTQPWVVESDEDEAEVNTWVPEPDITIDKYDTLDGDDGTTGHFHNTNRQLQNGVSVPIKFTITNTGNEPLKDIVVVDKTIAGVGVITGLSCDFSPLGGPTTGTTWVGPFAVGASFDCTGELPGLAYFDKHTDKATVTGTGVYSGKPVTDDDIWNGEVPPPIEVLTGGLTALQELRLQTVLFATLLVLGVAIGIAVPIRRWKRRSS